MDETAGLLATSPTLDYWPVTCLTVAILYTAAYISAHVKPLDLLLL
jgi:hypothetical protein